MFTHEEWMNLGKARFAARDTMKNNIDELKRVYRETRDNGPAETTAAYTAAVGYKAAAETLGTLVNRHAWDGRISRRAAAWAETVPGAYDEEMGIRLGFYVDDIIHLAHFDQIVMAFMRLTPPDPEKDPKPETERPETVSADGTPAPEAAEPVATDEAPAVVESSAQAEPQRPEIISAPEAPAAVEPVPAPEAPAAADEPAAESSAPAAVETFHDVEPEGLQFISSRALTLAAIPDNDAERKRASSYFFENVRPGYETITLAALLEYNRQYTFLYDSDEEALRQMEYTAQVFMFDEFAKNPALSGFIHDCGVAQADGFVSDREGAAIVRAMAACNAWISETDPADALKNATTVYTAVMEFAGRLLAAEPAPAPAAVDYIGFDNWPEPEPQRPEIISADETPAVVESSAESSAQAEPQRPEIISAPEAPAAAEEAPAAVEPVPAPEAAATPAPEARKAARKASAESSAESSAPRFTTKSVIYPDGKRFRVRYSLIGSGALAVSGITDDGETLALLLDPADANYPAARAAYDEKTAKRAVWDAEREAAAADRSYVGIEIKGKDWVILMDGSIDRATVTFKKKPSAAVRQTVKDFGFWWAPTHKQWVRRLNNKAWQAAQELAIVLKGGKPGAAPEAQAV